MYSGIIQQIGKVADIATLDGGGKRLTIESSKEWLEYFSIGSSVNVSGICLTVVEKKARTFQLDIMPQTLALSTINAWGIGTLVNLEASLRVGDEVGGHFLYGHVDGVATLLERLSDGNAELYGFDLPESLRRLVVPQGSIALDGVSLTVVAANPLTVSLIPETIRRTTLGSLKPRDRVNVEIDMLIKYLNGYGTAH